MSVQILCKTKARLQLSARHSETHFVNVHVGLSSRASLEHDKGKVILTNFALDDLCDISPRQVESALCTARAQLVLERDDPYLVSGALDGISDSLVQAVSHVDFGCSALEHGKGLDQRRRHALLLASNVEVLDRAVQGGGVAWKFKAKSASCLTLVLRLEELGYKSGDFGVFTPASFRSPVSLIPRRLVRAGERLNACMYSLTAEFVRHSNDLRARSNLQKCPSRRGTFAVVARQTESGTATFATVLLYGAGGEGGEVEMCGSGRVKRLGPRHPDARQGRTYQESSV